MHELDVSGKLDKASRAAVDALAELARGSRLRYLKLDGEPPLPVGELKGEVHAPSGGITLSRRHLDDAAAVVIARCVRGNTSLASLALRCDLQALGAEAGARLAAAVGASSIREIDLDGDVLQLDVLRGEEAAEHIELETARLGSIASAVVAACLGANRLASSLRVRTRDLSLTSCATLAEAVRGHPSLTSVELDGAALPVHQLSGLSPAASLALQAREISGRYKGDVGEM